MNILNWFKTKLMCPDQKRDTNIYQVVFSIKVFTLKKNIFIYYLKDQKGKLRYLWGPNERIFKKIFGRDYDLGDTIVTKVCLPYCEKSQIDNLLSFLGPAGIFEEVWEEMACVVNCAKGRD